LLSERVSSQKLRINEFLNLLNKPIEYPISIAKMTVSQEVDISYRQISLPFFSFYRIFML